jgi:glyoxylase-like metal-dependent hydrolase (beta-lactamase superfamily II)
VSAPAQSLAEIAGLRASEPYALPFAPSLHVRAFRLARAAGDLVVYGTPAAAQLGAAKRHYLNHWHEATFAGSPAAPLFVNEHDREAAEQHVEVAHVFSKRHVLDGDFHVIPTPGHTPGATAFLWDNGDRRLLFTGDTIYLDGGEWAAAVLDSSDRAAYLESLELIRGLDFDVLVPWAATARQPFFAETDPADARRRIDAIAERIRRGELA